MKCFFKELLYFCVRFVRLNAIIITKDREYNAKIILKAWFFNFYPPPRVKVFEGDGVKGKGKLAQTSFPFPFIVSFSN